MREAARNWRERNPEKQHERNRRFNLSKFGLTVEQYDAMHEQQGGVCAICGRPETRTRGGRTLRLAVDHDHETGAVRDLLCADCNKALGAMQDSPQRLRDAADYLERHGR